MNDSRFTAAEALIQHASLATVLRYVLAHEEVRAMATDTTPDTIETVSGDAPTVRVAAPTLLSGPRTIPMPGRARVA